MALVAIVWGFILTVRFLLQQLMYGVLVSEF